jgi:glycosyltransferase involved in cell wall biosynthesis
VTGLTLFFCRRGSLQGWSSDGFLERELALYRILADDLERVTFVTYGYEGDEAFKPELGRIRLVCNRHRLPRPIFERVVSDLHPLLVRGSTVLKSNQVEGADVPLRAAQRWRKKFIARCGYLLSHFSERRYGSDSPQAERARGLERRVFTRADRVSVTTEEMRAGIVERYGVDEARIRVIPNYVDTEAFRPRPNGGGDPLRICFVGRLDDQKNPVALVEAVSGLDAELVMVGAGRLRGEVERVAADRGVRLSLPGRLPHAELPELFSRCDVFVLPSNYEGHPKALLEAMAAGLPVVGTDVDGVRSLLRDHENGLVTGTAASELREAIRELAGSPALRERLGRAAREFVVENYSLAKIAPLELGIVRELSGEG